MVSHLELLVLQQEQSLPKLYQKSRNGEGIGYFALSMTLATAIGPFIGIFILQRFSFNIIFIFCLICVAISLFLSFFLKVQEITLTQEQTAEMKGFKFPTSLSQNLYLLRLLQQSQLSVILVFYLFFILCD